MDEWLMERYSLAKGRIWEICTEKTIKEPFAGFFRRTAEFLKKTGEILEREEDSLSLAEYEAENRSLYEELFPQISEDYIMKIADHHEGQIFLG